MATVSIDGLLLEDDASEVTLDGGRYTIVQRLGAGGMARVYLARDRHLSQWRAIKLLTARRTRHRSALDRFEREARTMAALDHPHLVRVYDFDWHGGRPYIVMEVAKGGALWDWMKRHGRPMHPRDAVRAAAATCRALVMAHERGVIHRDIKPNNILIASPSRFKLTDFGIALLRGHAREARGARVGTDGFLAPEQEVDPGAVDRRADIYGVGATLYALTTGLKPRMLYQSRQDPSLLKPVPEPLRPLIARATAYHPDDRFQDAQELLTQLDLLQLELPHRPKDIPELFEPQVDFPGPSEAPTGPTIFARQRSRLAAVSTVPIANPRTDSGLPDAPSAIFELPDEVTETTLRGLRVVAEPEIAAGTAGFAFGAALIGVAAALLMLVMAYI